jgi:hypothetical protein
MESQRQLRDKLLTSEWEHTVAPWAANKGLAEFEKYVVEKGREADVHVRWEVMQVGHVPALFYRSSMAIETY